MLRPDVRLKPGVRIGVGVMRKDVGEIPHIAIVRWR
jgi:hypothetical protein